MVNAAGQCNPSSRPQAPTARNFASVPTTPGVPITFHSCSKLSHPYRTVDSYSPSSTSTSTYRRHRESRSADRAMFSSSSSASASSYGVRSMPSDIRHSYTFHVPLVVYSSGGYTRCFRVSRLGKRSAASKFSLSRDCPFQRHI